jgi:hypothetical protein
MRTATNLALVVCAGVLWAGSALAQDTYDVTFQVDMSACIVGGQFDPETEAITTPGSMNGWDTSQFPLADDDEDGVYTGTFALPEGQIFYKFFASGPLGWEQDPNREYTVTTEPDQEIPEVLFNGICGSAEDYEIVFSVDMSVAIARGAFDEAEQEVYVAGNLNGWDTSGNPDYRLIESSTQDNVYTGIIFAEGLATPSTQPYKFITREISSGNIGWESGPDRTFELTGDEDDADGNGYQEVVVPERFFDDIGFDDVLTGAATVTFEVDMRPAFYLIEDTGSIPGDASGGNPQTSFEDVWINGPAMWESDEGGGPGDGIQDWLGWGPDQLGTFDEFRATDADGDSIYTLTLNYSEGALRILVGKWGAGAYDNEARSGYDHFYVITEGNQTIDKVFGALRESSGYYGDDDGPGGPIYDPYILIDNGTNPPTVEAVRSGGEADGPATGVEEGPELPEGVTLSANYPNPFSTDTRIAFRLERGQAVALRVYDLTGRLVATLAEGFRPAGDHVVSFDARGLASGTYLYRLEADGRVVSRIMTVLQ